MLVTFDLFSALLDSRTGGSAAFDGIAGAHGWGVGGEQLYDRWDAATKASQRDLAEWVPFAEHSRRGLAATYAELGLDGDVEADVAVLLASMAMWPMWPDVLPDVPVIARQHRAGILSNVDDDVFRRTRVATLVEDDVIAGDDVLTSERLRAYKPRPEIYRRALERAGGDLVHVATSARDVRGALEAGIRVIRLRRIGHGLDPEGPQPEVEAADLQEVRQALQRKA